MMDANQKLRNDAQSLFPASNLLQFYSLSIKSQEPFIQPQALQSLMGILNHHQILSLVFLLGVTGYDFFFFIIFGVVVISCDFCVHRLLSFLTPASRAIQG